MRTELTLKFYVHVQYIFQEYSRESNALFEGSSSIYFGDIAPFRSPVHSPSTSRILKRPPRIQNNSSFPTWVEPLGVWLTNKQVTWVKVFYTDISSCVLNNGWSSDFFNLSRGVRQGCPLSPYLFILCAEILGNAVRKDNEVHGIKIFDTECKLSQYADDTTMILDGSKSSFLRSLYLLDSFASISGLKANYEKTEALWIGASKSSNLTFPSSKPITWANEKVFALGVWFSTLEDKSALNSNFIEKVEKIRSILDNWSARRLTLLGKIAIIKTLAVSQIVYILSSLPTPPDVLKTINSILYDFLWDGKGDKIKRTTMINSYAEGGLKMLDIQSFNESLAENEMDPRVSK